MNRLVRILILFFLCLSPQLFAQNSDEKLANQYFQNGEYEKASLYYSKLYNSKQTNFYYNNLYKCYLELERYNDAEKLVKKQLKKGRTTSKYYVDLGFVYNKQGEEDKSLKLYQKALKDLNANRGEVVQLAKAFLANGENELALETYQKGRKLMKGQYPFNVEIAEIHGIMRNHEAMISEYLDLLEISQSYIQMVQNALARSMSFEARSKQNQLLKIELLKRIQKYPDNTIYAEMLIWIYMQMKDFKAALVQTKALDKRYKEDGKRVYNLGMICKSNKNYDLAIEAFNYVISKSKSGYYYQLSKSEILAVLNEKITSTPNYTEADLIQLESKYKQSIKELGNNNSTVAMRKDLALLQAYYLHQIDTAIITLEGVISTPAIRPQQKAECKLILGDFLIITGDIWDASLYYAQVDKDFKYDQLGEQAKLRNAKVSYYTGNFNFAKGQLDVLKGSTSKLISNDAMDLSLLITDNSIVDTTTVPLEMFARADLLAVQNKDSVAILTLDSINTIYPGHSLADEILFKKFEIAYANKAFELGAQYLEELLGNYNEDILADNALYELAQLYDVVFDNKEKAISYYEKLLLEHPGSLFVVEARKRYRTLRGDNI